MSDVTIRFECEDLDGLVAVGTFAIDAMRRFGVDLDLVCDPVSGIHNCAVLITEGSGLLSEVTSTEVEHFAVHGRRTNERLACEAKIERSGEVVIMTDQKKTETPKEPVNDRFQAEFEALPLDKKFAKLFKMEAVTLGETISYVMDSPFKVFEKIGDVMADFGKKIEEEAKKAKRPAEAVKTEPAPKKAAAKPPTRKPRSAPKA